MVTKRITAIRNKGFGRLARESFCYKKNFVLEYYSRNVGHMTNSRIFKSLIWNEMLTETFAASYRKYLNCLNIIQSWLSSSCYCIGTFWKTKYWSFHIRQRHSFRFCYEGVHNKKYLSKKKQMLLRISLRP